jgi:hypothetical protein
MSAPSIVPPFDPERYKTTTRDQWDSAAQAWHDWAPTLRQWLGPATDLMLDERLIRLLPRSQLQFAPRFIQRRRTCP